MTEERKIDRRVKRTEKAIQSAFIELLKEKDFESITVNDIVSAVDLSRGTFYLHYKDKYDLLEQMQNNLLDNIADSMADFCNQSTSSYTHKSAEDTFLDYLLWLLKMYQNNAELILLFMDMTGEFSFIDKIESLTKYSLQNGLYPWLNIKNTSIPEQYISTYLFSAQLYTIIEWLKNGCHESPEKFAKYLMYMNQNGAIALITSSQEKP